MTFRPLISTGLQPGVPAGEEPSRFNGLALVPHSNHHPQGEKQRPANGRGFSP
jgi:hypothetical protein